MEHAKALAHSAGVSRTRAGVGARFPGEPASDERNAPRHRSAAGLSPAGARGPFASPRTRRERRPEPMLGPIPLRDENLVLGRGGRREAPDRHRMARGGAP